MTLRYRRLIYRYAEGAKPTARCGTHEWAYGPGLSFAPTAGWRPSCDVYETATDLVVKVELAGVQEEDIDVTLYEDVLLVTGRREPQEPSATPVRYYEACVRYGYFQAEIGLPVAVDCERVAARYDRGFLRVTLPKLHDGGGPGR